MSTTQTVILIAHTVIALLIIVLVLLQRGKGADAGAAFGSGASGTVFGARGSSNFFSRATAIMATVFFVSSLTLAYLSSQRAGTVDSLLEDAAPVQDEAPIVDEEPPALPELDDTALAPADEATDALPELESAPEDVPEADDEQ